MPSIVTVQAEGNAPLNRAYTQMLADGKSAHEAAQNRSRYMFPWANPNSIASGILDDETYDWVELARYVRAGATCPVTFAVVTCTKT